MSSVSRRILVKGTCWAAPVISIAATAPAVAASPVPKLAVSGRATWNKTWYPEAADPNNYQNYKIFSTISGTTTPGNGYCVNNTSSLTTIQDFVVTFYLPDSSMSFSSGPAGTNGWSTLTRDTSLASKSYNSKTYYAYTTRYAGTIKATNGNTCLPPFEFQSTNYRASTGYFYVDNSALIDGVKQVGNYGPLALN